MRVNVRVIRKHRRYSEEFKRAIVSDFEGGKYSVLQLAKLHGIGDQLIYNWIYKYSKFNEKGYRVVENKDSSGTKVKSLEARVKELEGAVGRKQMSIDYLEKMIELAEAELGIEIKKKCVTQPLPGSVIRQKGGSL
jgi:transposase-like protein